VIKESQQPLSELKKVMEKLPQRLANVRVKDKRGVISSLGFLERLELYNRKLKGRGRVLARLSGTESVVRIMVESEDEEETARITDELAQLAKDLDRGQEK
jgi:phosphoglucosamine mutase